MIIELNDTTSAKIASAIVKGRRSIGSPTSGMVLTLIVPTDEKNSEAALEACLAAGREHPSRILLVVHGKGRRHRLDAEVRIGEEPGEIIVLRVAGDVAAHADSVVLPLLLPDSPVVVWWPGAAPDDPVKDQLGALADRRITDAMGSARPLQALEARAKNHARGDTDLTWTRLTPWRVLLAASLDQYPAPILRASVEASRDNAPADLLASWLEARLKVDVQRLNSRGPGITAVRMTTPAGDIAITRADGLLASYVVPGQPHRLVALRRRDTNQLLAEELRRMDADDIFEQAARMLVKRLERTDADAGRRRTLKGAARRTPEAKAAQAAVRGKAPAKKTAAKKTTATKAAAKKTTAAAKKTTPAKKTTAKKSAAKQAPAKKTTTKKAAAKKTAAGRSAPRTAPRTGGRTTG
ncbi:OxPP cycle protein OpcA [Enemella evansiae]|uniref:glucose-6-phosphate dehydrogenase assembly protein OpcA n=1 Tax=Enemella evansiae TaxID=2016499 RepID=UPI000B96166C|nr:glucose-6-phosphate dehydrogenase assembly protein OpcA [Enemella evansiae]OYO08487.1 OxPP cycle protein OpcA [Enemella evansiae]